MDAFNITHQPEQSHWLILDADDRVMGQLDYVVQSETHWHIHHTEVEPMYQGQGIAKRLVEAVADFAQEHGLVLSSSCSYASLVLARYRV